MSETKFIVGDAVTNLAPGKYVGIEVGAKGNVMDVYQSKSSGETVYEVQFANASLVMVREADLKIG